MTTFMNMACSAFGIRTAKEPDYTVVMQEGEKEIRRYDPYIVAKTRMAGDYDQTSNPSFRRLAAYIFGDNTPAEKIPMTAPVVQERLSQKIDMTAPVMQEKDSDVWIMSFVMPSHYKPDTLPRPLSPEIEFEQIPGKTVAVLRYSGLTSEKRMAALTQKLMAWIKANHYIAISPMRSARYDPPWTLPFLRRNEILIDVRPKKSAS